MADERAGHSLQATALVNEAYLRLVDAKDRRLAGPRALPRRVGARHAAHPRGPRARAALQKRGGDARGDVRRSARRHQRAGADFVALDDALEALAKFDERKSRVDRAAVLRRAERGGNRVGAEGVARDRDGATGGWRRPGCSARCAAIARMTPERWKRIEELYHAARARPPGERAAFLAEACRGRRGAAARRRIAAERAGVRRRVPRRRRSCDAAQLRRHAAPAAMTRPDARRLSPARRCSAPAAWARCTARATRSSGATSRSRSCRARSRATPIASRASSARRGCSPR